MSRVLVRELDRESLDALRHEDISSALERLEPGCTKFLDDCSQSDLELERLATDFCHLFLMSKTTSPCASAWVGNDPVQAGFDMSQRVDAWMEQLGVEVAGGPWGNLPRDHLAILLGSCALALHRPVDDELDLAEEILDVAIRPWAHRFVAAVLEQTDNPFYRAVVKLLVQLT